MYKYILYINIFLPSNGITELFYIILFFSLKEGYVYWLSDKHIMRSFCDSQRVKLLESFTTSIVSKVFCKN